MKFLLINPPIYDFAAYDVWLKPLGLLYLASLLKKSGHSVAFFDYLSREYQTNFKDVKPDGTAPFLSREIPRPDLKEFENIPLKYRRYGAERDRAENFFASHSDADCVVVTLTMVYWYKGLDEVVDSLKKTIPARTRKFLGGVYPALLPDHTQRRYGIFFEKIFSDSGFGEFSKYLGIKIEGEIEKFPLWPAPDYSFYSKNSYIVLRKSYGCCFSGCDYCASRKILHRFYVKSAEQVVTEIDELIAHYDVSNIAFYDDMLLLPDEKDNVDFLRRLSRWRKTSGRMDVKFFTPNGLNPRYVSPLVARLLKEAGFCDLRLSMESASDDTQSRYGPKSSLKDFDNAMKNLLGAGYERGEVSAYVLAGLPSETMNDVRNSVRVASEMGARVRLCEFSPVPRTKIFRQLGLDEKTTDPILFNNTTFIATGIKGKVKPWCQSWEELNDLKGYVRLLNRIT